MSETQTSDRRSVRLTDKTSVQLGVVITFSMILVGLTCWAYAIKNTADQGVRELVEVKAEMTGMRTEATERATKLTKFESVMENLSKAIDKLSEHDEAKMAKISSIEMNMARMDAKLDMLMKKP